MNYFIIANNPKYINTNNAENKYQESDKVVRLGNTWKAKNCKEILKDKTDYHILRKSKNHFSGAKPKYKENVRTFGIVGHNVYGWAKILSIDLNTYNPIIELNDIQENITKTKVSSGFGVAHYFSNKYPDSSIYLVGFGFQGYSEHNWIAERNWCSNKENIILI